MLLGIYFCRDCKHLQTAIDAPDDLVLSQYTDHTYANSYVTQCGVDALESRAAKHVDLFLKSYHLNFEQKESLRVCDVGAGAGWFLRALEKRTPNWELHGVEISKEARDVAQRYFGNDRIKDSLTKFTNKFDAMTFFDVLEHLKDPIEFLKAASEKLELGGMLICVIPGWNIWDRLTLSLVPFSKYGTLLMKKRLSLAHISVFSEKSLNECVIRSGFAVLSIFRFTDIGKSFSLTHYSFLSKMLRVTIKRLSKFNLAPSNRLMAVGKRL